jgi:hypothetical protein
MICSSDINSKGEGAQLCASFMTVSALTLQMGRRHSTDPQHFRLRKKAVPNARAIIATPAIRNAPLPS